MTKQAMNYLLGQLEARGYIERRAEKGSSRRLVFLTNRGWQVRETILAVGLRGSDVGFSVSGVSTNS
jgi:DNA-binding MarR family transcriptional regulator